jgi:hypothetical protein
MQVRRLRWDAANGWSGPLGQADADGLANSTVSADNAKLCGAGFLDGVDRSWWGAAVSAMNKARRSPGSLPGGDVRCLRSP